MKILCVHPNYELYGSDRSFAQAVAAITRTWPERKLEVLLPRRGPILGLSPFDKLGVRIRDMWILRRRSLVKGFTIGLPGNLARLYRAWQDMERSDLVYINTLITFDFIFMARFTRTPVIVHVREIPNGLEMQIFRQLLLWSKARLIFNSMATRTAFQLPDSVETSVVYNGFNEIKQPSPPEWDGERPLRLLVLGRFNNWKGQELVIEAIGTLSPNERRRVHLRLVGETFDGQDEIKLRLQSLITQFQLKEQVQLCPFESDPTESFKTADLVIVPSRLPEPFGRVAIEAMAHARPVICSANGGLVEIVEHERTGYQVTPSDVAGLAQAIRNYLTDPSLVTRHGEAGLARFLQKFTSTASDVSLIGELQRTLTSCGK